MSSDDEFGDNELSGQAMIDILDHTELSFIIPYPPSTQKIDARDGIDVFIGIKAESSPLDAEPDFADQTIAAALEDAEMQVIGANSELCSGEAVITLTRAELELIKRNAFIAGRRTIRTHKSPFPFLALPAELRIIFYKYYFFDRNPLSAGHQASALPNRLSDSKHCCSSDNTWCKTVRPRISTNILLTCKQIYRETRDDFLYKDRRFKASVGRFDVEFKAIRPHLRFWHETGNLIVHLVALLRGGQNLKSFKLKYAGTGRVESITRFKDLSVRGPVSLTQVFRDWFEPEEKEELRRKERLERLLFSILGCACGFDFFLQIIKREY
jgi:hypothetical protein